MAIGTLAAIGLGLAGVGSIASSRSQSNASRTAAQASNYGADRAADVIRQNYSDSAGALAPWQRSGLQANALLNDFYGIGGQPAQPVMGQPAFASEMGPQNALTAFGMDTPYQDIGNIGGGQPWGNVGWNGQPQSGYDISAAQPTMQPTAQPSSADAFRRFIENSDYGFQFGEGANRINSGYAGAGTVKSGAAMKGLERFRQNLQQGYRGEWAGGVGNQQQLGFGAASAQAGVSQNVGNSLANIYQQQGNNNANAALARGNSGIGNSLLTIGGGLFGYGR